MTSCGGTVSVIVRRSTFTIRSTTGIRMKRPGPFGWGRSRPSRKMIPRSYSRATLIAENRKRTIRNRSAAAMKIAAFMGGSYVPTARTVRTSPSSDSTRPGERVRVESLDADALAGPQLLAAGGARLPQLAVDEDEPVAADLADRAGDGFRAHLDRRAAHLPRLAHGKRPDRAEHDRDGDHERLGRVVRRRRVLEEHDGADREAGQARNRECSVTGDVDIDHEAGNAGEKQDEAGPADGKDRESEERRDQGDEAKRSR